jgi:MYXO-CTERM domain-containing protein
VSARSRRRAALLALVAIGFVAASLEGRAHACGGCFCNAPPPDPFAPLPIAQNGENVVFAITKDPAGGAPTIDAHIQILYTGSVSQFSWVVPVEAVPVLSTGSDKLFTSLATITQPQFAAEYATSGTCKPDQYDMHTFNGASGGTGSAGTSGGTVLTGGGNVQVAFQGAVGPYDAAVIKSDDPTALKTWLTTNGYTVTDAAGTIIDMYVREMKYFVALKLQNGVGVSAIQPIVLTFKGTEPCVPLRLTAIAANKDMPVLVWVLGDKRVVPRGFFEMKIDEARIDWWNQGSSYFGPSGLVSQAANEAGGDAFVTEYAGPATIASQQVFAPGQINLDTLKAAQTPPVYVQALLSMGLGTDPLTLGLLQKFIPMPDAVKAMNVTPSQFYSNLQFYWNMYMFAPVDLAGLTDAISTSIVTPRMNAQAMIDAHPYLTRLNTYLSPDEMNQDAFFFENTDLPDVSNLHKATIRAMCGFQDYMACNAPQRLELADGRLILLSAGSKSDTCSSFGGRTFDATGLASLPACEVAYKRESSGEGTAVVDNRPMIQSGIAANNVAISKQISGGCSCAVAGGNATTALAAAALGLALLVRRRRRDWDGN